MLLTLKLIIPVFYKVFPAKIFFEELLYGFGKIDSNYRGWLQQDDEWAEKSLSLNDKNNENNKKTEDEDTDNTMAKQGCKVIAAAKILCTIMGNDSFAPSEFIEGENRIVDSEGNLSKENIIEALENAKSAPEVKLECFEWPLNEADLKELKHDPDYVHYILAHAWLGGGFGQHWVVIEDYTVLSDGTLEYQVVGSSENDEGRIFRSDPDFATDGK